MKDAQGHGSNGRGVHAAKTYNLPARMTRAHFEEIASQLHAAAPGANATQAEYAAHSARISNAADQLSTTNPGFNRQRFISAASGKGSGRTSRASSRANAKGSAARVFAQL